MSLSAQITHLRVLISRKDRLTPLMRLLYQAQRQNLATDLSGFPVHMIHQIKIFSFIQLGGGGASRFWLLGRNASFSIQKAVKFIINIKIYGKEKQQLGKIV